MTAETFDFKAILQKNGWKKNVRIAVDQHGIITDITSDHHKNTYGYAIPSFYNAHSHAFQYAMAGLAENHPPGQADNFWSWRTKMYEIALQIGPDELEDIAAMLYAEMVSHGYSHVAEFHYLHHDKQGKKYTDLAEHAHRLIQAAKKAGINITIIPMYYKLGGFGKSPEDHQRRFISSTLDHYLKLLEATKKATEPHPHAQCAYGIHSIRAVDEGDIQSLCEMPLDMPFHIHIAEQLKEVEEAKNYLGSRPVDWLMAHVNVNENFHLVHATHLTNQEISAITRSGARVVLCPSTEANLGDGIFPLQQFQENKGQWSIGTDSHIGLNPLEEIRILDYGQRLVSHSRNIMTSQQYMDSGQYALRQSFENGQASMANQSLTEYFEVGQPLNAAVYNSQAPLLETCGPDHLASAIVYSCDRSNTVGTIINGRWIVKHQEHINRLQIENAFKLTMRRLKLR